MERSERIDDILREVRTMEKHYQTAIEELQAALDAERAERDKDIAEAVDRAVDELTVALDQERAKVQALEGCIQPGTGQIDVRAWISRLEAECAQERARREAVEARASVGLAAQQKQISELETDLAALRALVGKFIDSNETTCVVAYHNLYHHYNATLDAAPAATRKEGEE